jgi:MGT family glycosyltransferase
VLRTRFEAAGCTFATFDRAREAGRVDVDVFDDNLLGWNRFISGIRLADDVKAELDRESADVVVVDCALSAALSAAEASGVPAAVLVHVLYQPSVEGDGAAQWDPTRPMVDATRRHLGLDGLDPGRHVQAEVWNRASLVLACQPEGFDVPLTCRPTNLRYVGPIFEQAPLRPTATDRPLVLVTFGTTNMRQGSVVQRVVDAAAPLDADVLCSLGGVELDGLRAPSNVSVEEWVDHREVLARASAVVTHAGLSTVMAALADGVPLVCLPLGRDQPWNADRVATLGLGRSLECGARVGDVRAAIEDVLNDHRYHQRALRMAGVIGGYGNGSLAVSELEAIL